MSDILQLDGYGALIEPATLRIQRRLPGPIERIWAYVTDSDLRRKWFAAGTMQGSAGGSVEFVWRNDELTDPPGQRPANTSPEHRLQCEILQFEPPHRVAFTFGSNGEVEITLEAAGKDVVLTLIHRRLSDRATMLKVAAGWHMHLDVLTARVLGLEPSPFWDGWSRLRAEYEQRLPA